ncbi:MAG: transposase, partial [Clostridia bacterium]|nr:transposase [Clostridia bacterium]
MDLPKRKHPRLKSYDYSGSGAYFVTICTHNRQHILSDIVGRGLAPAEIQLFELGQIANSEILNLEKRY